MNAPVEAPATFRVRCWNCCRLFDVPADAPLVEQSRWVAHKRGHLFVNECCGGCGSGLFLPKDGSLCESDGPHDQPSDADMYFLAGAFVEDGMATLADRESRLSALARGDGTHSLAQSGHRGVSRFSPSCSASSMSPDVRSRPTIYRTNCSQPGCRSVRRSAPSSRSPVSRSALSFVARQVHQCVRVRISNSPYSRPSSRWHRRGERKDTDSTGRSKYCVRAPTRCRPNRDRRCHHEGRDEGELHHAVRDS